MSKSYLKILTNLQSTYICVRHSISCCFHHFAFSSINYLFNFVLFIFHFNLFIFRRRFLSDEHFCISTRPIKISLFLYECLSFCGSSLVFKTDIIRFKNENNNCWIFSIARMHLFALLFYAMKMIAFSCIFLLSSVFAILLNILKW